MNRIFDTPLLVLLTTALFFLAVISVHNILYGAESKPPAQAFPGKKRLWKNFERSDFLLDGRKVLLIAPAKPAPGRPWTLVDSGEPRKVDEALLKKGLHFVSMDLSDDLGGPQSVANWDALYRAMTEKHGLAKKVVLQGYGRGGLILYNWAAGNPEKIACIHADAPALDIKSWPGGKRKGTGDAAKWEEIKKIYGLQSEKKALAYKKNPIDKAVPLAKAKVPILHVGGDADTIVPFDENTGILKARYEQAGGTKFRVIKKRGAGHTHGLKDPTALVYFILKHTTGPGEEAPDAWPPEFKTWKPADFSRPGKVFVRDGVLFMETGRDMTGANWTGPLPRTNYEITLEAMRVEGDDFFCGLTFPVGPAYCSFIVGGWSGTIVGLSCLDYNDAANNETTQFMDFQTGRWYEIRVRVTEEKIEAWIDDNQMVDVAIAGRTITVRFEVEASKPLGISTWRTTGALRNFDLRPL